MDDSLADAFVYGKAETASPVEFEPSTLPLEQIQDRVGADTRPLNPAHVEELAKSIALLGLIEPLVVDKQNRLLAGSHRRAAILQLWENDPGTFDRLFSEGVPAHRLGFSAEHNPELAVQIEIAENEQRRDYTPAEVRAIADRFTQAGMGVKGRPSEGQTPLIPALMAVVGKSRATIHRYLADEPNKESVSVETLSRSDYDRMLQRARKILSDWLKKSRKSKAEKEVATKLMEALKAIDELLNDP